MPVAYFTRALIYIEKGDLIKARQDVDRCIELTDDPDLERAAKQILNLQ